MKSSKLKSRFQKDYLDTDNQSEANKRLQRGKLEALFTQDLIEERRKSIPELDAILSFLGV